MEKIMQYKEILKKYRNDEFGDESLHLNEILEKAGYPNILNEMSDEELDTLANESYGMSKSLYLNLKKKKSNAKK